MKGVTMVKGKTKALTFIVGLVTISVTIGVILHRNPKIRKEAEQQAKNLLRLSQDTIETAQEALEKVQKFTGIVNEKKEERLLEKEQAAAAAYEEEWDKHVWNNLSSTS